jgi:hypothetical protein
MRESPNKSELLALAFGVAIGLFFGGAAAGHVNFGQQVPEWLQAVGTFVAIAVATFGALSAWRGVQSQIAVAQRAVDLQALAQEERRLEEEVDGLTQIIFTMDAVRDEVQFSSAGEFRASVLRAGIDLQDRSRTKLSIREQCPNASTGHQTVLGMRLRSILVQQQAYDEAKWKNSPETGTQFSELMNRYENGLLHDRRSLSEISAEKQQRLIVVRLRLIQLTKLTEPTR